MIACHCRCQSAVADVSKLYVILYVVRADKIHFFHFKLLDFYLFFLTFHARATISSTTCAAWCIPFFHTGIRLQVVFAHIYMFPIDVMLPEFTVQHIAHKHMKVCSASYFGVSDKLCSFY